MIAVNRILLVIALCAVCVALSGCGKGVKRINLVTADWLNPTSPPDSTSAPVKVRVYFLKDDAKFSQATFEDIYDADQATLGTDWIDMKEMFMYPDTTWSLDLPEDKKRELKFVGVFGEFRDYDNPCWRGIVDASKIKKNFTVRLARYCVEIGASPAVESRPQEKKKARDRGDH